MRAILQRVSSASVTIQNQVKGSIGTGLLVLLGIAPQDTDEDAEWLCRKITAMRIFADGNGLMNLSVKEAGGNILLVSQFTLYASTK
ncbi:MAG: D-tyrosyl-tRNA(Tyr) deacylase, partial [Chitinophagaceae bacterium]